MMIKSFLSLGMVKKSLFLFSVKLKFNTHMAIPFLWGNSLEHFNHLVSNIPVVTQACDRKPESDIASY